MEWIELSIKTTSLGTEPIVDILLNLGITGTIIEDPNDLEIDKMDDSSWDYVDESLFYKHDYVLVKSYVKKNDLSENIIDNIRHSLKKLKEEELGFDVGLCSMNLSFIKEDDWANNWKSYFKPKKIGEKIVIRPSWETYSPKEGEIVLNLDPGMAFGTGTHETTILCIKELEKWINADSSLMDIGCGTGILSIASALLGAKKIKAIDISLDAVEITKQNAKINNVEDKIEVFHGNLLDNESGKYDIIVANIIADIIILLVEEGVDNFLNSKGIFIASGIILDRIDDVKRVLVKNNFELIDIKTMGEWAAIVCKKGELS